MRILGWLVLAVLTAGPLGIARAGSEVQAPPRTTPLDSADTKVDKPRDLPPPEPVAGASLAAPCADAAHGCNAGCHEGSCWQRLKDWACYRPCKLACCGEYDRYAPPTPPLYTYFLYPPCVVARDAPCVKDGCCAPEQGCGHCGCAARFGRLLDVFHHQD
jgi:hypothetical protein